jgi:hypothetical protein
MRARYPPSRALCCVCVIALCGSACGGSPMRLPANAAPQPLAADSARADNVPSASAWPEAEARFRSGGAWLGGDGAYSIELGPQRILWLFADTFIDPRADGSRVNGPNFFIHNSVAIQSGADEAIARDLSRASLSFSWGHGADGTPSSFFHDIDAAGRWIWPLAGVRLPDGKLLLFRMQIVSSPGGFGFAVDSWDALAIDDADDAPDHWQPRTIAPANKHFGKLVGSSVVAHGAYLYAYAVNNQGQDHAIFLARWPLERLSGLPDGALRDPEWYTAAGFVPESALAEAAGPAALFSDGQVEFSVHYERERKRFVQIQMQGLFISEASTQIGMRTAARPEGPWSPLAGFYRPGESALTNAGDLAAYAAKAHPEQRGADLVLTYVVNDVKHPTPPDEVYYPEPLRLRYVPAAVSGDAASPPSR